MSGKLFVCEHPKTLKVERSFNGVSKVQVLNVGCGVCAACLKKQAAKRSLLCTLQESDYKYTLFFTLTYSPQYVPLFKPVYDSRLKLWYLINLCTRLGALNSVLDVVPDDFNSPIKNIPALLVKSKLNGCLSYVSVRDMQLFMKRLRKHLYNYGVTEKVKYYISSEYGPRTFRAHYHGLLYFNDEKTLSSIYKALHKAWSFGRLDASLSRHKTSSYVSGYVNNTYYLPRIFAPKSVRPFSLHSSYFGLRFYQSKAKKIHENAFNGVIKNTRYVFGKELHAMPWRSFENAFFPKITRYAFITSYQLYDAYVILQKVVQLFGVGFSIKQYAKKIVDLKKEFDNDPDLYNSIEPHYLFLIENIFGVIGSDFMKPNMLNENDPPSAIVSLLYCSKRFLSLCDIEKKSTWYLFNSIVRYYNLKDYEILKSFYQNQVDLSSIVGFKSDDYKYLYDNINFEYDSFIPNSENNYVASFYNSFSDDLKFNVGDVIEYVPYEQNVLYKRFVLSSRNDLQESIKHKELNDLNKIFL